MLLTCETPLRLFYEHAQVNLLQPDVFQFQQRHLQHRHSYRKAHAESLSFFHLESIRAGFFPFGVLHCHVRFARFVVQQIVELNRLLALANVLQTHHVPEISVLHRYLKAHESRQKT